MKKSLPCFSALVAAISVAAVMAQSPSKPQAPPQTEPIRSVAVQAPSQQNSGDELLAKAANQLERRASISARLEYNISIGGQDLKGVGMYWQQGSGEEFKTRLELAATQDAKLLQVSNSRFLWIDRRLPTGRSVTRYDLRQLRADPALAPPGLDSFNKTAANLGMQPLLIAHSGGLPSMLASLRENFSFRTPQPMQLEVKPSADAPDVKLSVYAVVGQWKPEKLAAVLSRGDEATSENTTTPKPKSSNRRPIPDRLPEEVLMLVGQRDLFPTRIEYRKLETPDVPASDGPPIPYQLSVHPLVVLEFTDVVFDTTIPDGQFDYTPGDANWVDQTAALIERLHRERQSQVATRSPNSSATSPR
jgi:hypothetical protein